MLPDLFEEFTREFTAEFNRQRMSNSANIDRTRQQIDRTTRQISHLVDAVANGADAKSINEKLKELELTRAKLETDLADIPIGQPLLHPNLAKIYREKVECLSEAINDPNHGRQVFEIIRGLIAEVRLVPSEGALTIELAGDLAGILAVCEAHGKGAEASSKALQIKMVAGVGFEPTTFRL